MDLIAGQYQSSLLFFWKNHSHFSNSSESQCTTTLKQKATRWILAKDFFTTSSGMTPKQQSTFDNSSVSRLPAVDQDMFQLLTTIKFHWQTAQRRKPQTDFTISITSPASYPAVLVRICWSQTVLIIKRLYEWTYLILKQSSNYSNISQSGNILI